MEYEHPTWKMMRPTKDEKYQDFRFEQYYARINSNDKLKQIPKVVFDQWIYGLHQDPNTLKNYAWLNYENIHFTLCKWSSEKLASVSVIKNFQEFYREKASCSDLRQFSCTDENLATWKNDGTWRVPPIIIDIGSLQSPIPKWSDLTAPYQLVEGHTRLGYLNSLIRISTEKQVKLSNDHWIYLMVEKSQQTNR
jgi:hypothetical protein